MTQSRQHGRTKLQFLVLGSANAGKTSILRRYFHKTFQRGSRVATLGSDFYVGRTDALKDDDQPVQVNLQMWDTPGRERFYYKRKVKETDAASMEASFFRHADAFMLVYDMMSSTSFTQLLKWYADLMEICKNNPRPILIVANKLDLFVADQQREKRLVHPRRVPQRDVMGLHGDFKGNDFRYEYSISRNKENEISAVPRTPQRRMEISSFLANHENWTTDGSYLESLINSEDGSLPDREMALLWCMRNGLKHLEVSAATGEFVDEAIQEMIRLALAHKSKGGSSQEEGNEAYESQLNGAKGVTEHQQDDRCSFLVPIAGLFRHLTRSLPHRNRI